MKYDAPRLSCGHNGISTCGETGPLFPPLHVNDAGKARLKAPPRNKMALFEQFTVPCSNYMGNESVSRQHGTTVFLNTCTQYAMAATLTPAVILDCGTGGIGKLSYGSGVSLSTCSAVVDADESLRTQKVEPEGETGVSLKTKSRAASRQGRGQSEVEELKKESPGINLDKVEDSFLFVVQTDKVYNAAVKSVSKGFHKWDNGSCKLNPQKVSKSLEHPHKERLEMNQGIGSEAVNQPFGFQSNDCKHLDSTISFSPASSKAPSQVKRCTQSVTENIGTARSPISYCDSRELFAPPPLQANIKPKDVIHAVGQQLFWRARKAILRQQEIFTNQVFELHKLIEIQRLLAKMPSTLIEDRLPSAEASLEVASALLPAKGNVEKQQGISIKGTRQTTAARNELAHEPKPLQKHPSRQDTQAGAEQQQTKRRALLSPLPHSSTKGPCGQAPNSYCSEGTSTWGYPIGPLNRPFFYPPGVCPIPPGTGVNGAYVVGSGPPVAPFSFPCYRPEQGAPFSFSAQWPSPIYHGSVLGPHSNDWFAMSHPSQGPFASRSEKPAPSNSVPSINMKAEASSQSVHPAAVTLPSHRPQVGESNGTTIVAAKVAASTATAPLSTQQDCPSPKPACPGYVDDVIPAPNSSRGNRFVPQVWRSCRGDTSVLVEEQVTSKESRQMSLGSRELSCEKNALDLFPLQPSGSTAYAGDEGSCGRIIKAIPRSALAASESAAVILRSIQRERQL